VIPERETPGIVDRLKDERGLSITDDIGSNGQHSSAVMIRSADQLSACARLLSLTSLARARGAADARRPGMSAPVRMSTIDTAP